MSQHVFLHTSFATGQSVGSCASPCHRKSRTTVHRASRVTLLSPISKQPIYRTVQHTIRRLLHQLELVLGREDDSFGHHLQKIANCSCPLTSVPRDVVIETLNQVAYNEEPTSPLLANEPSVGVVTAWLPLIAAEVFVILNEKYAAQVIAICCIVSRCLGWSA